MMDNSEQAYAVRARGRICIDRMATVIVASKLMRSLHVDELVVVDREGGVPVPLGVVSAQHIVTRILAAELDPGVLTAGDIAWPEISAVPGRLSHALQSTLADGNRILPVFDCNGDVSGIVWAHELAQSRLERREMNASEQRGHAGSASSASGLLRRSL
jgi:CBS domain-containing protein